jgi:hypothetical protein
MFVETDDGESSSVIGVGGRVVFRTGSLWSSSCQECFTEIQISTLPIMEKSFPQCECLVLCFYNIIESTLDQRKNQS